MRRGVLLLCLFPLSLSAKDYGVQGKTFDIQEESLLKVIERRLRQADASGKIHSLQETYAERVKQSALRPKAVETLETSRMYRAWSYDPTLHIQEDIKDHEGTVIAAAGTALNPLHTVSWGDPLLFINGDEEDQVSWALSQKGKIVLTKGSSIELEDRVLRPIFFDQGGSLIKRFEIRAVPARVSQKGEVLFVEEVPTHPSNKEDD